MSYTDRLEILRLLVSDISHPTDHEKINNVGKMMDIKRVRNETWVAYKKRLFAAFQASSYNVTEGKNELREG